MPLSENPTSTPILDRLLPTITQFMPLSPCRRYEGKISTEFRQKLLNDWLTRQEIEAVLESISDEHEQKYFLFDLRFGHKRLFENALSR